jgi:hypothetical protein
MSSEGLLSVRPKLARSELHPEVTLVTTAEIELLVQGACEQRPCNQLVIGPISELLLELVASERRAEGFKH